MIEKLKSIIRPPYGWSGDFKTWEDALKVTTRYDTDSILTKVSQALQKVKNGEALYERDSVLFYEPLFHYPLLASLQWAFKKSGNSMTIVDFGGSLGSSYYQHRKWLQEYSYSWNVIEQKHFVAEGKKHFENDVLKFYYQVNDVTYHGASFLILSSVLPYLEKPYEWLETFLAMNFDFIFLDRVPLVAQQDRITVQRVPPEIYEGSYPAWFFNKTKFMTQIMSKYEIWSQHVNEERAAFPSEFLGFFLVKKQPNARN